jgi:hypothetical protein
VLPSQIAEPRSWFQNRLDSIHNIDYMGLRHKQNIYQLMTSQIIAVTPTTSKPKLQAYDIHRK